MAAKILNGKTLANKIRSRVKEDLLKLKEEGKVPYLVSLQVGENSSAQLYIEKQRKSCQKLGIRYGNFHFDPETPQSFIEDEILSLNHNPVVSGIILQMPFPSHLDPRPIYSLMDSKKDVEGMHPENLGQLTLGRPSMVPCTAMGAFELIKSTGVSLEGKEAVVVGHSEIVGKPLLNLLLAAMVTTTSCHIATQNLKSHTSKADILVVATGVPGLIKKDMVKPGAIVVDVGINRIEVTDEYNQPLMDDQGQVVKKTVGDIAPDVAEVAGYITPVPGGVGPVTVAMLLQNTVRALMG